MSKNDPQNVSTSCQQVLKQTSSMYLDLTNLPLIWVLGILPWRVILKIRCGDIGVVRPMSPCAQGWSLDFFGAVRTPFPISSAQIAVINLFAISVFMAHSSKTLLTLLSKHARRFPPACNHIFDLVRRSIAEGGAVGASTLVEAACMRDHQHSLENKTLRSLH